MNKAQQRPLLPLVTADMRRLLAHLERHDGLRLVELDGCWPVWTDRVNHRHWTADKTRTVLRQCRDAGMLVLENTGIGTEYRVAK
jgi:hypothetical protein